MLWKNAQIKLTVSKRKMHKVVEVLKKIIQKTLFWFNYVLRISSSSEGGFVSSSLFPFVAWNAYWSR